MHADRGSQTQGANAPRSRGLNRTGAAVSDYHVDLDAFHGPLDLLLYLVRRDEVDILDIPIARLADQILAFLAVRTELDVDLAGDFLVTAATLLELKARALLPAPPAADPAVPAAADPRRELVKQLLEYRQFKDAAALLEDRAERHNTRLPRLAPPADPAAGPSTPAVRPVELWDLVSAFARLMRETELVPVTTVQVDDTPQHVHEERVLAAVRAAGRLTLRDLFTPPHTKARLIGLFLAILELVKRQSVRLELADPFAELWVTA